MLVNYYKGFQMSKKVYCIAQFLPKEGKLDALFTVLQNLEPNTMREDGCLQYTVTRQLQSPFAEGASFPIAFNEVWADNAAFEAHCQREEIKQFFTWFKVRNEFTIQFYFITSFWITT